MIRIGEKLNSSIKSTQRALATGDENAVIRMIESQAAAGANYLDLNAALFGTEELQKLAWLIDLALRHSDCGLMLDSPNADILRRAADLAQGRALILNSVTVSERISDLAPCLREHDIGVVGLLMAGHMPDSAAERLDNAERLVETLRDIGVRDENIYADVLVETLAGGDEKLRASLDALAPIKARYPRIKTMAGVSNASFGLPNRMQINAAYLTIAGYLGLDAAIFDVTALPMRDAAAAAEAVAGRDEYCMEFITHARATKLERG